MSKRNEINYVEKMEAVLAVPRDEVSRSLLGKPFNDPRRGSYFIDLGQLFHFLPPPPARILDLGVGPGWTSRFMALSAYEVLGLDIAPRMIELAEINGSGVPNLTFQARDYEDSVADLGTFDAAVIYDALHHSLDEARVIRNVYSILKSGGSLITMEPGFGHSTSPGSLEAVQRFGTTEKDMEFDRQRLLMAAAGFADVRQYYRLSELPLERVDTPDGRDLQSRHFSALSVHTLEQGFTSIVVAVKAASNR
jgi:SAM-dependent methyltransferase